MLYLGTERGVAFSTDDGDDLAASSSSICRPWPSPTWWSRTTTWWSAPTAGRSGFFDDLTPLRDDSWRRFEKPGYFFNVQPATRWRYREPVYGTKDIYAGKNPPPGAVLYYHLKARPKEPISLEIVDIQDRTVIQLSSKKATEEVPETDPDAPSHPYKRPELTTEVGVNRVVWDLRYAGAERIKNAKIDTGEPAGGPLALPGTYTLRLTVDGLTLKRRVDIVADPRTHFKYADLEAQLRLSLAVRDDLSRLSGMVEQIRSVRGQLQARQALLKGIANAAGLVKQEKDLLEKLDALEGRLHNPQARVTYDILAQKGGAKLYSQLGLLFEATKDSDGSPTQGVLDMYALEKKELQGYEAEFKDLVDRELARINEAARKLDLGGVMVPAKGGGR